MLLPFQYAIYTDIYRFAEYYRNGLSLSQNSGTRRRTMANGKIRSLVFSGLFLTSVLAFADTPQKPYYDILDYGAIADGKTLNTQAIQSAIDDAAQAGGGVVLIPAGSFLSGSIFMKSHITLHLQSGAALLGSKDIVDYAATIPQIRSYTDNYVKQSLIYGENLEDVAITGRGTIDGQGAAFRWKEYKNRPYIIRFISCRQVLIEDIFLKNSPMWMQHYLACEEVTVRGIRVVNHSTYNNDGIDIDSCRNVRIDDCSFDSDDDALCLKSTTSRPCEDIAIANCVLSSHCNAFKMGTESNGGFTDIVVSNLSIHPPRDANQDYGYARGISGISLEIVDGGCLDRVSITNITMQGVSVPLFLRLGNRARPYQADMPKPAIGAFRNVSISHVIASGVSNIGCSITGQPEQFMENIALQDISLEFEGGGTRENAGKTVAMKPQAYPEATMFGALPAYGFYCRYVKGLSFNNIQLRWKENDFRSSVICENINNLEINGFSADGLPAAAPIILLRNVRNAFLRGCRSWKDIGAFLSLAQDTCEVTLMDSDLHRAAKIAEFQSPEIEKTFYQLNNRIKKE